MANLHLLSQSINADKFCQLYKRLVNVEDRLLLIADAVLLPLDSKVLDQLPDCPIYVLQPDVQCRGLTDKLPSQVQLISDEAMVQLTLQHQQVTSW